MNNKNRILALSIKQPFAEAILRGIKSFEERDLGLNIRGRVYIYASMTPPKQGVQAQQADRYYDDMNAKSGDFPVGVLVGTVEIFDCEGGPKPAKFRWCLRAPERLPEPIKPENRAQPIWFRPFKDK